MASAQSLPDKPRKPLTTLVYAVLILAITTTLYVSLSIQYDRHLISSGQFGRLRATNDYSVLADSLFYLFQMVVALMFFRPLSSIFAGERNETSNRHHALRDIGWGVLGGILALVVGEATSLPGKDGSVGLGAFLVGHLYSVTGMLMLVVLIFLLPIVSEGLFRGVLLRRLVQSMSPIAAVIVAALVFMFFWPTFTRIAGLAVGLVAGILFYRTKSILPCIVANCTFTIGAVVFLTWRAL
jgi:membrane protease YdiL (CAAX protease family)